ncbi:P-loop containing nucleoside triphosphate hydrolase protein [Tilletiaria anomala UBC 951]|uniref:p-loop containing nucleoside triphosphate hydrolase protein n=1 Tax=Tilletiaria anomala (strain ATCC 24038 / CBS 436.72 / UBC 951) TaxID=1037660 RepID=A0A066WI86_TILAU|nr:P-loop containing nucleoside triphosphate hydrolase protein [Tilletiaria anomala UBC 951]KDN52243.1 P-loop containing nucleoside triphosphate hydrolase protein [Tilletiaria anomala UBC 951]
MLHLISGLYSEWTRKIPFNVLILGPEGAGKSCLIEAIKTTHGNRPGLPADKVKPTIGQNIFELPLTGNLLRLWDLGGSEDMQKLWQKYYKESHALLWVVDARWWDDVEVSSEEPSDSMPNPNPVPAANALRAQAAMSWDLLAAIMQDRHMSTVPFLIVLNKTDQLTGVDGQTRSRYKTEQISELEDTARLWWGSRLASVISRSATKASKTETPAPSAFESAAVTPSSERPGSSSSDDPVDTIWDVLGTSAVDLTGVRDMVHFLELLAEQRKA